MTKNYENECTIGFEKMSVLQRKMVRLGLMEDNWAQSYSVLFYPFFKKPAKMFVFFKHLVTCEIRKTLSDQYLCLVGKAYSTL